MNEAADILNFSFSSNEYASLAETVFTESQKIHIEGNARKLGTIAKRCSTFEETLPSDNVIQKAYNHFASSYTKKGARFTVRELRYLIYSMHRMKEKQMFDALIDRMGEKWSYRYTSGLMYYVLSQWDSSPATYIKKAISLIEEKIAGYRGTRDKYLTLKQNIHFLSNPALLGFHLRHIDKEEDDDCSLEEATKMYFGLSQSSVTYEFMSPVISAYFEKDALSRLKVMKHILKIHNNSITPKRLIPAMIVNYGESITLSQQNQLINLAISLIGDPSMEAKWSFSKATPEEQRNLTTARIILNGWVKEKFINIFFDKCVHETRRKNFWLEHIKWIRDFKVVCTETTFNILKSDNRLAELIEENENVYVLNTEVHLDKAALILTVGNYYMVEFSDVGSIYLYQMNSNLGRIIQKLNITNFGELKRPRIDTIQSFSLYHEEGKLPHEKGWEDTLYKWMSYYNHI
jgi:hypothetical protein